MDKSPLERRQIGGQLKPLTFKPRWKLQITLFVICAVFPIIQVFYHHKIPFHDQIMERLVHHIWFFEERETGIDFSNIEKLETVYDAELEAFSEEFDIYESSGKPWKSGAKNHNSDGQKRISFIQPFEVLVDENIDEHKN